MMNVQHHKQRLLYLKRLCPPGLAEPSQRPEESSSIAHDVWRRLRRRRSGVRAIHRSRIEFSDPATLELAMASTQPAGRLVQVGFAGGTAHVTALKTVKPEGSVSVSWWGNIRELREVLSRRKAVD